MVRAYVGPLTNPSRVESQTRPAFASAGAVAAPPEIVKAWRDAAMIEGTCQVSQSLVTRLRRRYLISEMRCATWPRCFFNQLLITNTALGSFGPLPH
jgi:hypothetical protein